MFFMDSTRLRSDRPFYTWCYLLRLILPPIHDIRDTTLKIRGVTVQCPWPIRVKSPCLSRSGYRGEDKLVRRATGLGIAKT